jgi:hypothetical protein
MRSALLVVLAGCGASGNTSADLAVPDLAPIELDLATPIGQPMGPCLDPPDQQPDGGVCVIAVRGSTVDESGAPLGNVFVTYCGYDCFYGMSSADGGVFAIDVRTHIQFDKFTVEVHGRPDRVGYYVASPAPVASDSDIVVTTPLPVPLLPASGPQIARDGSMQTLVSGDVTLALASGTKVTLDPEDLIDLPLGGELRAWRAPNPAALPFVTTHVDVLYALAPFEVLFSVKTPLSIVNAAALPANAVVDVLAQRSLANAPPPAGALERVAGAHVSADGSTILFDAGEGVTLLDWIALVKK